jgi:SAM-dependent methyltransferase
MRRVLEFGCGCGRVFRYWHNVTGPLVYGNDRNPQLVAWCQQSLPFGCYALNELEPPLAYEAEAFDFVYAISVFTHLTETLQMCWIDELRRILKPGGHLLLTIHGASYRQSLTMPEQQLFDTGRLVVRSGEDAGTNLCGAYHPESYVKNSLGKDYRVVDFIPAGMREFIYQDIFLLSKGQ